MQQKQGFGAGPGGPNSGPPDEFIVFLIIFVVVLLAISITIQVFFLLTLSRALHQVHPRNRKMEPAHVWFLLIPCFNLVWIFFLVTRIPDSLRDEYYDRGLRGDGDFGRSVGMTYAIMILLANIPYIGGLFGLVGLVFFILFWVKIAGYARELREDYQEDDFDDDRPRRRLRGRDDADDRGYRDDDYDDRPRRRWDDDDRGYRDDDR